MTAVPTRRMLSPHDLLLRLRDRQEAMVGFLRELVEAESPSSEPDAVAHVQTLLFYALEERGLRVRRLPGRRTAGALLGVPAERRRAAPVQLLLGHCDTVWPLGTLASMPAVLENGRLRGPGAFDMKAGLVQIVFALEALRDMGLTPVVTPIVFLNGDEEIGSGESVAHIRRLARLADRCFVLEPALGPDGLLKTARKGVGRFTVRIRGRAAHAGLDPEHGASAILELSHVIRALFELNDPAEGVTVNVGTIAGGINPNVVAPESKAVVDVRVLRPEDGRRVAAAIRGLRPVTPGTTIEVEGAFGRPPLERTPRNRALWRRARAAAAELGLSIGEGVAGGGSDGNFTSAHTATLDGLGAVGDGAHADHEHVIVDRMPERTALLARLLLDPPLDEDRPP